MQGVRSGAGVYICPECSFETDNDEKGMHREYKTLAVVTATFELQDKCVPEKVL